MHDQAQPEMQIAGRTTGGMIPASPGEKPARFPEETDEMQILIKAALSLFIIFSAAGAKKFPSAAGPVAVMPLAGALVLVWVYIDNKGDSDTMRAFSKGAVWGVLPSIAFYLVAFLCFRRQLSVAVTLLANFGAWSAAAIVHQLALR